METRMNKYGGHECVECGITLGMRLGGHECDPTDVVVESVRKVIARGIAHRLDAHTIACHAIEEVGEFIRANDLSVVDGSLNIMEVLP